MKFLFFLDQYQKIRPSLDKGGQLGFTLLELLVTMLITSILALMAYPMALNQIGKARVTEARNGLGVINRSQQAYLFEYSEFATSMQDLYIDFTLGHYENGNFITRYYVYSVKGTPDAYEVHHLAAPIKGEAYNTKTVVSAVFHRPSFFSTVICEARQPSGVPDIVDQDTCDNGRFVK